MATKTFHQDTVLVRPKFGKSARRQVRGAPDSQVRAVYVLVVLAERVQFQPSPQQ